MEEAPCHDPGAGRTSETPDCITLVLVPGGKRPFSATGGNADSCALWGGGVKGIVNPETPGGGIGDGRARMPALRPHRGRRRLLPELRRPHHGQGPHAALPRPVEERPTPGTGEAFGTTPFVQVARGCLTPLALPGSGTCSKHLNRDSAAAISAPSRLSLTCPFKPPSPTLQSSWVIGCDSLHSCDKATIIQHTEGTTVHRTFPQNQPLWSCSAY